MIATQDSFTKELFSSLHLEWNKYAEARDVLTKAIYEDETLAMLFEDIIFTLNSFFKSVKKDNVDPYYEIHHRINSSSLCCSIYELKINLDIESDKTITTIFRISPQINGEIIFLDNVGSNCKIADLEELQIFMVRWFEHFYERYVV